MIILDGKETSQKIAEELNARISDLKTNIGRDPRLDIFLVGSDFGSEKYVSMKKKKGEELGVQVNVHQYASTTTAELVNEIGKLNTDKTCDGIMVQLPLPKEINRSIVINSISSKKDVDGLTSTSLGLVCQNDPSAFLPATAKGIIDLLIKYGINPEGKNAVVIGRSIEVGLPVAAILQNMNATVSVCHSKTVDIQQYTKNADILVCSVGKPKFIKAEHIKEGVVLVDVGINKDENGNLVGDIDFESVKDVAGYITPVPGGVGPMTIISLISNLVTAYEHNR